MNGKVIVDHDDVGITALRDAGRGHVIRVAIGEHCARTILLATIFQDVFIDVAVDHAADAGSVTHIEFRDVLANRGDDAHNFMTRNLRVLLGSPMTFHLVNVRVADTGVLDFN